VSTIYTGLARLLIQCLSQAGVNVMSVYGRDDLQILARLSSETRMPIEAWDDMIARAQQELGDVDVVLKLAEFIGPMDRGAVGFITMACRDLLEAAQAFAKFYPLLSDAYTLELAMLDDRLTTRMQPRASYRSHHLERFTLASICRHSQWLVRRPALQFDAHFAFCHPSMNCLRQYQEAFGGNVLFGMQDTVLYRPPGAERLVVSQNGKKVKELLWSTLSSHIAMLHETETSLLHKVEHAVAARLQSGDVRIEGSADDLGVPVRTLQVRLKERGISFRIILDRTRHRQALALMEDGNLSLVDIATRLGFASQSSFTRAFHRWTQMSPGAYQKQRGRRAGDKVMD
jgi:AraC-like DNA-binding protein